MNLAFLRDSIGISIYDFTYGGYSYKYSGSLTWFNFAGLDGYIAPYWTSTRVNGNVNTTLTVEFKINQDGQTASSGQIPLTATYDSQNNRTNFEYKNSNADTYKLYMPFTNGRLVTIHAIARVNGVIQKDTTFQTMAPINLNVSSISPSPQTGKVGTVNLTNYVVNHAYWTMTEPFKLYAYHNTSSSADYNWYYVDTYINDGTTKVDTSTSTFNKFQFYFPYASGRPYTDNAGKVIAKFKIQTFDLYTYENSEKVYYQVMNFSYEFTWSYVNQYDNNAGPIITNKTMTPTPSGYIAQYGKYIGGGKTKLNFGWSVSYRFGASFSKVTYSLYEYSGGSGTLINEWEYSTVTGFNLTLSNTVDKTYYVVVTITVSNGTATADSYGTFQVYGYSNPEILSFNASRCNQDGTANDSGGYCKITYQFKITSLDNQNGRTVTLTAPDGSHVYTNLDYNHGSAYQYISVADIEHSYPITLTVQDDFLTVSRSMNISTAGVIMDFLYDGKGIGLGKVAETTEMVEVNPEWTFKCNTMTFHGQDLKTILESLGYVFPS